MEIKIIFKWIGRSCFSLLHLKFRWVYKFKFYSTFADHVKMPLETPLGKDLYMTWNSFLFLIKNHTVISKWKIKCKMCEWMHNHDTRTKINIFRNLVFIPQASSGSLCLKNFKKYRFLAFAFTKLHLFQTLAY